MNKRQHRFVRYNVIFTTLDPVPSSKHEPEAGSNACLVRLIDLVTNCTTYLVIRPSNKINNMVKQVCEDVLMYFTRCVMLLRNLYALFKSIYRQHL